MKVVAILQARTGSTRLPGKMLLPLSCGVPLVQHVIERVKRATLINEVVLAFPSKDIDAFAPFAHQVALYGYSLDETDLVGRYLSAAVAFDADIIVRIPCDNPCVDTAYIDAAVTSYMNGDYTFYTNTTEYVDGQFVDGVGAEVLSLSRLKWLDVRTVGNARWREHPHTYFYDVKGYGEVPADVRLDVNTLEDYFFIKNIYDHFGHNRFTTSDVLAYLETKKVLA